MNVISTIDRKLASCAFDVDSIHALYETGTPVDDVLDEVLHRISDADDPAIFISLLDRESIFAQAAAIGPFDRAARPLWGIPFAVKDNIDVKGMQTTAACPAFAFTAGEDAHCVALLRAAGAILIGKTNLDQFATGLVGVRSPYGFPRNAIDPALVPGGSSSGSAVAVARGIVSFALGTDTAGSGRTPAALNNIVGFKPTLGAISNRGVLPACRTLDTVSIFTLTIADAVAVYRVAAGYDPQEPFSRKLNMRPASPLPPSFEVLAPDAASRLFFGDAHQAQSFEHTLSYLAGLGAQIREIDLGPFFEVARLLYEGPWVAERYTVLRGLLTQNESAVHPVVAGIVKKAENFSAADAFEARYRLEELRAKIAPIMRGAYALCVPSIPAFCSLADVAAEPVEANSRLGTYTNFVNLLDMCGIATPCAPRADGLPGSVTLLAEAGADMRLAALAGVLQAGLGARLGASSHPAPAFRPDPPMAGDDEIELAVVGAHMSGLPLNKELAACNARFLRAAHTAPDYRFYALAGGPPFRPGMVRAEGGASIALETWAVPRERFGDFIAGVPSPLCIGSVKLNDGSLVKGFLCEASGLEGARDITEFGGWRNFISRT